VIEQAEAGRTITLDLGRAQAVLPYDEQVPTERYRKGQRTKVFLMSVRSTPKGPEILVSRSHKNMIKRLFEIEVPEVYNGVVEIKAIAREAGFRSKVAVTATQPGSPRHSSPMPSALRNRSMWNCWNKTRPPS